MTAIAFIVTVTSAVAAPVSASTAVAVRAGIVAVQVIIGNPRPLVAILLRIVIVEASSCGIVMSPGSGVMVVIATFVAAGGAAASRRRAVSRGRVIFGR